MQAAGLLVVAPDAKPWQTLVDLRVDDHPEPLNQLRRLLDLNEGYQTMDEVADRGETARRLGMDELDVRFADILDAAHGDDVDRAQEFRRPGSPRSRAGRSTFGSSARGASSPTPMSSSSDSYDVAILGGGAAWCVLAARLSESPDRRVCLVEAGPDYGPLRRGPLARRPPRRAATSPSPMPGTPTATTAPSFARG